MKHQLDPRHVAEQARQRIRVGMIGLAAVVLLIGLASAIFSTVTRDRPVAGSGIGRDVAVAPAGAPSDLPSAGNEPLAELGVAPSIGNAASDADRR